MRRRLFFLGGAAATTVFALDGTIGPPARAQHRWSPYDFGAVGDGVANDTEACVRAAQMADERGAALVFPPGTFAIDRYVIIQQRVPEVRGLGGVIRCVNTTEDAGLMFRPRHGSSSLDGCRVVGLRIDCNFRSEVSTNAIFVEDVSRCRFLDNHIFNLSKGTGILIRSRTRVSFGNEIAGNTVKADRSDDPVCWGIAIEGSTEPEWRSSGPQKWRLLHQAPPPSHAIRGTRIVRNEIEGGYYGVSLCGATLTTVVRNVIRSNTRSIAVQHRSDKNRILRNHSYDSKSSAIHLAYGSRFNEVVGNEIHTTRANGEGLLQAYVGAQDNLFRGNHTSATGSAAPKYHAYAGVHADRNAFVQNQFSGNCARAYIAVESGFKSQSRDPRHRGFGLDSTTDFLANRGMRGVRIRENTVYPTSPVPAVYLAQISDGKGDYALSECEIVDNVVARPEPQADLVLVEEKAGLLRDLVIKRNRLGRILGGLLQAPRGLEHCKVCQKELVVVP